MSEDEIEATVELLTEALWKALADQPPTSAVKQTWAAFWAGLQTLVPADCVEIIVVASGVLDWEGVWNVMLTRNVLFYGDDGDYVGALELTVRAPALDGEARELPKLGDELRLDGVAASERTSAIEAFRSRLEADAGWRELLRTTAQWQEPQVTGQGPL